MGRKKLTKACHECSGEYERTEFSRSMWEKEEERMCRDCDLEQKRSQHAQAAQQDDDDDPRSARAKKRRVRMNQLFDSLADTLALPISADRAVVLERAQKELVELRAEIKKLRVENTTTSSPALDASPLISMEAIAAQHLFADDEELVVPFPPIYL